MKLFNTSYIQLNHLPIMIHLLIFLNLFSSITSSPLQKRAYTPLPLGTIAPQGWLLEQLILQANALSGVMATSTFPGANTVNQSLWIGGNGQPKPYGSGVTQWLPYWTNGQIPLVELLVAANVTDRLDSTFDLINVCEDIVQYILAHTNKTNGWIGPYLNEPGDTNGHGLWDPLNMLRTLLNYAQAHPEHESSVVTAVVSHLTHTTELLNGGDPVIDWASTRWPTYVEIAQYVLDNFIEKYGTDPNVMVGLNLFLDPNTAAIDTY